MAQQRQSTTTARNCIRLRGRSLLSDFRARNQKEAKRAKPSGKNRETIVREEFLGGRAAMAEHREGRGLCQCEREEGMIQ